VTTPDDRVIDSFLIDYVSAFVPNASGEYFNPHVSTGLAPRTYLDKLLAEPLVPFTFSPVPRLMRFLRVREADMAGLKLAILISPLHRHNRSSEGTAFRQFLFWRQDYYLRRGI
jgi:hypothetical protein